MSTVFAADGCVQPDDRTRYFRLHYVGECEHATVPEALLIVRAWDEAHARRLGEDTIRIPRAELVGVYPVDADGIRLTTPKRPAPPIEWTSGSGGPVILREDFDPDTGRSSQDDWR